MAHVARRCTKTKDDGTPCKAWAVRGSDPPLCGAHGGGRARPGAPVGNKNAEKHGAYVAAPGGDLDRRIAELNRKIARLSDYIDANFDDSMADGTLQGLLDAYGRLVSRVGRLERDRQAVTGGDVDALDADFEQALAVVSEILGLDLSG